MSASRVHSDNSLPPGIKKRESDRADRLAVNSIDRSCEFLQLRNQRIADDGQTDQHADSHNCQQQQVLNENGPTSLLSDCLDTFANDSDHHVQTLSQGFAGAWEIEDNAIHLREVSAQAFD